ncbi:MAG: zinc-binding alcohol dehydrogenase [Gammaproteobacteria bacterium]|nr:zinc-binding alcohol dehydrogenase [Gammaproteobacteria bacterium]
MNRQPDIDARAFWIAQPGRGEIRPERVSPPGPDEVLVSALYGAISRGTEALVFQGRVPASEFRRMRAPFQAGEFPAPVKYGYASVGVVEEGPSDLRGREVFCLHPHQTHYVVPIGAVHPLPPKLPPQRAVLAANMETALNGVWDAAPAIGDRVAVVGAGVVGCLTAWLAAGIPACAVELIDVDPSRRSTAAALGVDFALPRDAAREADVVIHASGSPDGLATALSVAAFEATVVELSWYGDRRVEAPLGEAFHSRRLVLKSSQVGTVAPAVRARRTTRERMALALSLLQDGALDALIDSESGFDELPDVMRELTESGGLCRRIRYAKG